MKDDLMPAEVVDIRAAALEVVEVLHKYRVPLSMMPLVFDETKSCINEFTVPYSPKALSMKERPTSETTSKDI